MMSVFLAKLSYYNMYNGKWGCSYSSEEEKESYNCSYKSLSGQWNTNTGNKMLLYLLVS